MKNSEIGSCDEMKKIAILVDQLYLHGGIERLVALKANYWSQHNQFNVTILSTENKQKPIIYDLDSKVEFIDLGINYRREISYFSIRNLWLLLKNIFRIQKYILNAKPEYILVASHIPLTYVLPFLILRNAKIIKEFHSTRYFRSNSKNLKQRVFDFLESQYDRLIVLSHEEGKFYQTDNVEVIPNPIVEMPSISRSQVKMDVASTAVRFAPVKRLELMIEAWSIFSKYGFGHWKLHIYGDYENEYGAQMIKLVKDLELSDQIIFKGKTNQVLKEIGSSKVMLMTSKEECFPMAILEAQSVGVPVISFDSPTGPRNIINNGRDGVLVEYNNVKQFAQELKEFASNPLLQDKLSEGALLNVQKYTMENIMRIWRDRVFI